MPRSFSKGKRGIAGTLVFIIFDRDALLETLRANISDSGIKNLYTARGNVGETTGFGGGLETDWNQYFDAGGSLQDLYVSMNDTEHFSHMKFVDQFPPFDITISMANENGQRSSMKIFGVQILNEGSGMSIDDMVVEKACTFVARDVTPMGWDKMNKVDGSGKDTHVQNQN